MKIKPEDLKFLETLGKQMNEQDKRGTSYPLFVVFDRVRNYKIDGQECEGREDVDDEWLCSGCLKQQEEENTLPNYCDECDSNCFVQFDWENEILQDHGIFFTAEACDEYIARRRYEFNKPFSYAISAYWSNEMRRVMEIICGLTSDKNLLK